MLEILIIFDIYISGLIYQDKEQNFLARRREECEDTTIDNPLEELSAIVVECGYELHVNLGPGLLESVYEALLAKSLGDMNLKVDRQKPIRIKYRDVVLNEGFRADLLVADKLLIELKSTGRHMHGPCEAGTCLSSSDEYAAGPIDELRCANVQDRMQTHCQ